jgi:signal transduction histidine kinase
MMRRLRPVILDELGLVPALQNVVDEWNDRHEETFCRLSIDGDLSALTDEAKINIFRIVQEALTNVAKHSRATEVEVSIRRTVRDIGGMREIVEISMADNGIGFDAQHTTAGLGLLGMRERTEALNGQFELRSAPGAGVRIRIILPVDGEITHV